MSIVQCRYRSDNVSRKNLLSFHKTSEFQVSRTKIICIMNKNDIIVRRKYGQLFPVPKLKMSSKPISKLPFVSGSDIQYPIQGFLLVLTPKWFGSVPSLVFIITPNSQEFVWWTCQLSSQPVWPKAVPLGFSTMCKSSGWRIDFEFALSMQFYVVLTSIESEETIVNPLVQRAG